MSEWDIDWGEDSEEEVAGLDDMSGFGNDSDDPLNDETIDDNDDFDTEDEFNASSVQNNSDDNNGLGKKLIIVGIIILVVGLLIARFALGGKDNNEKESIQDNKVVSLDEEKVIQDGKLSGSSNGGSSINISNTTSGFVEIEKESIEFNSELNELQFTITGIKNYAKNMGNELRVKTVLTGALSGYTGVYELEVPYDKGINLNIGDSFTVYCRLGQFNGKVVIGEISY